MARALLVLAGLAGAAQPPLPACLPYQASVGHWDFPEGGGLVWDPAPAATPGGNASAPAPCAWSTPTLRALAQCMPGATLVFGGDSVVRYMVTTLGLEAWRCGQEGVEATPEREHACNNIYGLKERKGDAVVATPPEWGAENLTLHFRYLRFGYEFLERAAAWVPDHLGEPSAADAIVLGGMGFWDARYRTHDTLLNILQRLGEDMAPLFERNPTLRRKLTVLSTTYSENFDGRMGMFPHDILDAINGAAAPAWRAMGVPWFDVTRYVRTVGKGASSEDLAGRMAFGGGKVLTQDGYHPVVDVQKAILREIFSHICEGHRAREAGGAALLPLPVGSRRDKLLAPPMPLELPAPAQRAGLAPEEAAGGAALAVLSCCCCLSARGRRCRRRCSTGVGVHCGCIK